MLKEFSTAEVKAEIADAAFVKFVVTNTNGGAVTKENSGVKISKGYGVTGYTYEGKSLNTNNELSYELQFRGMAGQDGAIYGDYLFRFGPHGEGKVYSLESETEIGSIVLDKKDIINPHNNSTHFGNEFYAEGDEFPLMYSTLWDNNFDTTTVYRVVRNGNTFTTKLVQVIKAVGTYDAAVDPENNKYYAFVGDTTTNMSYSINKYELPKLSDGVYNSTYGVNLVTLTDDDILSNFELEYPIYVVQGSTIHDGKYYITSGFTSNQVYLNVYDLEAEQFHCRINLEEIGLIEESEFICFKDGVMYLMPVYGNIYTFKFY